MERADIDFHAPGRAISGIVWPSAVQLLYPLLCFTHMLLGTEKLCGKCLTFLDCLIFLSFLKMDWLPKKHCKQVPITESVEFQKYTVLKQSSRINTFNSRHLAHQLLVCSHIFSSGIGFWIYVICFFIYSNNFIEWWCARHCGRFVWE